MNRISERYLVTGVQLGVLIATQDEETRKRLVDTIVDKQFIGRTNNTDVVEDTKKLMLALGKE